MLGLGDYESNSEDEVEQNGPSPNSQVFSAPKQQHWRVADLKQQRNKDIPPTTLQASQDEGNMPLNSPGLAPRIGADDLFRS